MRDIADPNIFDWVRGILIHAALVLALSTGVLRANELELGFGLSQPALNATAQPWAMGPSWRITYLHSLSPVWQVLGAFGHQRFLNDPASTATIRFLWPNHLADRVWKQWLLDVGVEYRLARDRSTIPFIRASIGNSFWSVEDLSGVKIPVGSQSGGKTDFAAQEMVFKTAIGLRYDFHSDIGFGIDFETTYFTGIGTDFSDSTDDIRSRATGTLFLKLIYRMGQTDPGRSRPVGSWRPPGRRFTNVYKPEAAPTIRDSDADGVPDLIDRCASTPPAAKGWVDVYGCPVDQDRDGVPDYRDQCLERIGPWVVNEFGCVDDADDDGVPDATDQCPDTPAGISVDIDGCPSYLPLSDKKVFRFNYASGGSRLNADARAQLTTIVPSLKYNPSVRISIFGYSDNIGAADANLALSQKRADRVKEFFVSEGIPSEQMSARGRGETNFVAPNTTRAGREQNRRIEIFPVP